MEEEEEGAVGGDTTKEDSYELKDSFHQQQEMIGQLGVLSKAHEKGIEDYTLRLARMKPRLLRGRGRGRGKSRMKETHEDIAKDSLQYSTPQIERVLQKAEEPETTWPVETLDLPEAPVSKSVEPEHEAPVMVELDFPEIPKLDNSRSKVLLLRKQLEENRIKFERQQRENVDKKVALVEMRERIDRLSVEVESRDHLIQSFQRGDTTGADPDTHILYQQILHKDTTILDLTEKLNQLEMYIQDQREQLSEKEQIIAARTEAVSLVAKDRDQKLQHTVNELETAKLSLHESEKHSHLRSSEWQDKEEQLNGYILEKDIKINSLEENAKRSEAIRFQLIARNAEVQDKLVAVTTEIQVINSKLKQSEIKCTEKCEEINELSKRVNRAEAFGHKKLKVFEKYFKSVEQDNLGERIIMLTNDISLLEEEKGNLQLKLVDCDEINTLNDKLSSENLHMEAKYDNLNLELKTMSSLLEDMEKEKILMVDNMNEMNLQKNDFDQLILSKESELEEIKQKNITLELSSCKLEEERDMAVNKLEQLESNDRNNKDSENVLQLLNDREVELSNLQIHINNIQIKYDQQEEIARSAVANEMKKCEENESLLQLLTNKEELISSQSTELSDNLEIVNDLERKLNEFNNTKHGYEMQIQSLENQLSHDNESMNQLREEIVYLQNELSLYKETKSSLKADMNELHRKLEDNVELSSSLQDKLNSTNYMTEIHMRELEENSNVISNLKQDLADVEYKYKNIVNECEDLKNDLISLENSSKNATLELKTELNILSTLISDKDNQILHLKSEVEIKEAQIKNNEIMVSKYEEENCSNNRRLDELLDKNVSLEGKINSLSDNIVDRNSKISVLSSELKAKDEDIINFQNMIIVFENEKSANTNKIYDLSNKNSEFEVNLNKMSAIISDKNFIISTLQTDIKTREEQINNNQLILSKFENDSSENITKIEQFSSQNTDLLREVECLKEEIVRYESSIQFHLKDIKDLQNLLTERETYIIKLKADIEFTSISFDKSEYDLELSKQLCLDLQKSNDDLKEKIELIKSSDHETLSELEATKLDYENEIVLLRQDIVDKQSQISYMENRIELDDEKLNTEHQALCDSSYQLTAMQQNTHQLKADISVIQNKLDEKLIEINSLNEEIKESNLEQSTTNAKLLENQQQLNNLNDIIIKKNKYIEDISTEKEETESENSDLVHKLENLLIKLDNLEKYNSDINEELTNLKLSKPVQIYSEEENVSSPEFRISQDEKIYEKYETVSNEKKNLERDLLLAQQAIVRLETSLATQTPQDNSSTEAWSDWGDVDLGQKNKFEPSLQTTLLEKDRVLNMTQEQLKDALEQVNTVVDEKKLIEHQMKVLEAELQHKDEKILSHTEEIKRLDDCSKMYENKCLELEQKNLLDESQSGMPKCLESALKSSYSPTPEELQVSSEPIESNITSAENSAIIEELSSDQSLEEVKFKLTWYEDMWPQWSENYNQMTCAYQILQEKVELLQSQLQVITEEKERITMLSEESKSQVSADHENEVSTLQNNVELLETSLTELKVECQRLQSIETMCSKMQANVQEFEVNHDDKNTRISELELMVQSAESEISRLRSDMLSLTNAGNSLEKESSCFKEEITNLKEEIRKINSERERILLENAKLQQQMAVYVSSVTDLEHSSRRLSSENLQLHSEIEILEGDAERVRVNLEFLESDLNRARVDNDSLVQNNNILETEKESLAHELQRISNQLEVLISERDRLKGEAQRLLELSTSAESEIARLKAHLESTADYTTRYQQLENQYADLQCKMSQIEGANNSRESETPNEIDWSTEASLEKEHFQASEQSEEIQTLTEQVSQLKKKKNSLEDEIYASKLKNGKMIQKLKTANTKVQNLQKELEKFKSQDLSGLDATIEAEWKSQLLKAESGRDEYKIKADEFEKEKDNLVNQIHVLHSAQEKFMELKEDQDLIQCQINERNTTLVNQVSSMEWKIAELEETLEEKSVEKSQSSDIPSEIATLKVQIDQLNIEKIQSKIEREDISTKLEEARNECEKMRAMLSEMKETKEKLENNHETYKTSYIELHAEHESLIDTESKTRARLTTVEQELNTLKFSYDSLYNGYNTLKLDRDTITYDLGIMTGNLEKLQQELTSLNNIQEALKEEEKESIIIALQEECAVQRQQNNELKDEIIHLGESIRQAEEEESRANHTLEQQLEIQELLRNDLNEKIIEMNYLNSEREKNEKELKYERAEVAALKSQLAKLQKSVEESFSQIAELEAKLKNLQYSRPDVKEIDGSVLLQRSSASSPTSPSDVAHVSDLRCRQLSLEINKLLEERDALQLKLSSTLRQNQELGRELSLSQQLPTPPPPNTLKKKLAELRELNSSLEEKELVSSLSVFPPTMPTFVSHTAPPTPTASRQTDLRIIRDSTSPGLVGWILGRGPEKELLHV